MSSSIVRAPTWNIDDSENFLAVARDEISLYGVSPKINNGYKQLVSRIGFDGISCFSFSPTYQGLTCVGQINGTATLFDIKDAERPSIKLGLKQARPCNSVCFNNNGLIALGVDKSRSDHSLHVYNISDYASSSSLSSSTLTSNLGQINPEYSLLPNEAVSSVTFYNDMSQVLLIGSYKFLRQIDLREAPTCSVQYATKCVYGISPDPFNPNYYASYSEDGTTVIWDRRYLKSSMTASNSTLTLTKLFNDVNRKSLSSGLSSKFKYCTTRRGEFSVLHNGDLLRRWQFDTAPKRQQQPQQVSHNNIVYDFKHYNTPGIPSSSLGMDNNNQNRSDGPFIAGVIDIKTDFDRVASFDYSLDFHYRDVVNYMCIRQSGQVFRMGVVESADSVKFDPCNNMAVAAVEGVYFEESGVDKKLDGSNVNIPISNLNINNNNNNNSNRNTARLNDDLDSLDGHESVDSIEFEELYDAKTVLQRDISVIMRNRALAGYSLDPETNFEMLDPKLKVTNDISLSPSNFGSLRQVWRWVDIAHNYDKNKVMQENYLDLGLEGVLGIWEGFAGMSEDEKKCRVKPGADESNRGFKREVETIVKNVTPLIYTAPLGVRTKNSSNLKSAISNEISSEPQRQMCLIVAGWDFPHSKLDEKLNKLVESGQYEKAAGWAVFHGDVKKAVTILGQSSKERLKLISTSIAGYFAYKDSPDNSMWRDRCRELAFEFDNCYLRAIFSYISEESWSEVLDDSTLPLRERLGIAFRFLPEDVLSKYLKSLVNRAIHRGDLEGLILTGLTPKAIDLLQSYVDRTGDVQTAALLISYGYPRFFKDVRAEYWIDSYKTLLNAWRLFSQRARFDIARNRLSFNNDNQRTLEPYPKQVYLRCSHCNKNIIRSSSGQQPSSNTTGTSANASSATIADNKRNNLLRSSGEQTTRCPHCNNPLPRCSVCLNSLGSSLPLSNINSPISDTSGLSASERQFERWFSFCLSCNHGAHIGHAREWFKKHKVCPVPDCNCNCNDK